MLSEEDNLKVAQLSALFPEIKQEIDAIEQSLMNVSDDANDAPSSSVKEALLDKLKALEPANTSDTVFDKPGSLANEKGEAKVIAMPKPKRNTVTTLLLAASIIGLIACIAVISHLSSANTHYHDVANKLQNRVNDLQQTASVQQKNLEFYQSPVYKKITLTSAPGKPDALVQLFWNTATHDVYVANISLPKAPEGKQYQLWALIDGKPVNGGLLTTKLTPQQMVNFVRADAFAITLEKAGGSPTPTLTQMFVIGKTS